MPVCTKYPGNCQVDDGFCSKRHKKALDYPEDGELEFCRTCENGKTAWEKLKLSPAPLRPCRTCKALTSNVKGICNKCTIKIHKKEEVVIAKPISEPKGGDMTTGVISSKVCVDCGTGYKPTSNVQKRCPECKAKFREIKKQRDREYHKNKRLSQVSTGPAAPSSKSANIGMKVGKISEPEITHTPAIVRHLLARRQEHITALTDIQLTLRNLVKYGATEISEETLAI